jgi:O-antigen/teichoic acid export membrane protein
VVASVAALVNVGLNFVLIPEWGIVGAGISTVIGYLVLVYLGWRNAQHSYPVDYEWKRVVPTALVAGVFVALSILVVPATGWVGVPVRIALGLLFPVALVAVGVVHRGEVGRVRSMLTSMGRKRSKAAVIEAEEEEAIEEEPVA